MTEGSNQQMPRGIRELLEAPPVAEIKIITAIEFPADQRERLTVLLQEQYNRRERLAYEVRPSVLGGVALVIGDLVIDNTLQQQLKPAEQRMSPTDIVEAQTETDTE